MTKDIDEKKWYRVYMCLLEVDDLKYVLLAHEILNDKTPGETLSLLEHIVESGPDTVKKDAREALEFYKR
jgi:hypothetical protein